ncbi:MAG: hypothetical protein AB1486_15410 [Planctomycetota bacterium]
MVAVEGGGVVHRSQGEQRGISFDEVAVYAVAGLAALVALAALAWVLLLS